MKRWLLAVVLGLVACGDKPALDAERLKTSRALGCVLQLAEQREQQQGLVADVVADAPPVVLRAIALAARDRAGTALHVHVVEAAIALAQRGATPDARALLTLPEFAALDDDTSIEIGEQIGETRLRAGLPAGVEGERALIRIREQALGGHVDAAANAFALVDTSKLGAYDVVPHLTALHALGREDDAYAVLATAQPSLAYTAHAALVEVALADRRGIARAVEALVAARATARATQPRDWGHDRLLLDQIVRYARGLGLARELAPLRRAMIEDVAALERLDWDAELLVAQLADEVSADERAALAPVLARLREDGHRRRVAATDALRNDPLDVAHGSVENTLLPDPALWLRLWIRHAVAGSDAAFEARLADSACALTAR